MRSSIILTAVLAGGALATPVKKWLEKRVVVTDTVTHTTVVWVTAGDAPATVQVPPPAVAAPERKPKEAVKQHSGNRYHAHQHKPAQPPKVPEPSTTPPPPPPAPSTKPAAPPVQQQPASTSSSPPPAASPKTESVSSDSTKPPTSYPKDLDPSSDVYKALTLQHHNIHRANHSASDLTWDDNLAKYAEEVAKRCVYEHDRTPGKGVVEYGQNIAAGTPAGQIAKTLTNAFYNDEMMLFPGYGSDSIDMTLFKKWGHFSQMLWKTTEKVGCYTAVCSPPGVDTLPCNPLTGQSYLKGTSCGDRGVNAIFTVCNYSPPGNYGNQYSNVGAPLGQPLVLAGNDGVIGLD